MGKRFKGAYNLYRKELALFTPGQESLPNDTVTIRDIDDPLLDELLGDQAEELREDVDLLEGAANPFDLEDFLKGSQTPVFFGSAINNFGVQLLLDAFLQYAPPPGPRKAGELRIAPDHPQFSGFIFKIQSNMDPNHRDQIAFLRVCSGVFARDMKVLHPRSGKVIRMSNSRKMFARERETVNEAFPGDVIGLVGHPEFGIGDTLTEDPAIAYDPLPQFAAECFAYLHHSSPAQFKRFRAGLDHLLQEGAVQTFTIPDSGSRAPLLGAVGPLQFEVLQYRLESEYGATTRSEPAPWSILRWIDPAGAPVAADMLPSSCRLALDARERPVALFTAEWELKFFIEKNPKVVLHKLPDRL
jgi:peptide chain release factor 3